MDPIITNALMTFGAGFATATFAKAKGPGQALDDAMTLVGFDKLHEVAEKKRAKRDLHIQQYKEAIAQKIIDIPEEKLREPPLSIIGPAIEASKYYIEEDSLRNMFVELIASSMNKDKSEIIQTSFVEVIKQMMPLDIQNLRCISVGGFNELICSITIHTGIGRYIFHASDLYLGNSECTKQSLLAPSLQNLRRLGLVDITYQEFRMPQDEYEIFKHIEEYYEAERRVADSNAILKSESIPSNLPQDISYSGPKLKPGLIKLTPFGKNYSYLFFFLPLQKNYPSIFQSFSY